MFDCDFVVGFSREKLRSTDSKILLKKAVLNIGKRIDTQEEKELEFEDILK